MKIKKLQIENFQCHSELIVSADGGHVELRGCNGVGKSAVWRSIECLLKGKKSVPVQPVLTGQEYSNITMETEDYTMDAKVFDDREIKIVLRDSSGRKVPGKTAKDLLKSFLGDHTLDGGEFAKLDAKGRIASLVQGIDYPYMDKIEERKTIYQDRQDVGRDKTRLEKTLESLPRHAGVSEPASTQDLLDKRKQIEEDNAIRMNAHYEREKKINNMKADMASLENQIAVNNKSIDEMLKRIAVIRSENDVVISKIEILKSDICKESDGFDGDKIDLLSTSEIDAKIASASEIAKKWEDNQRYEKASIEVKRVAREYDSYSNEIKKIDDEIRDAMASIEIPEVNLTVQDGDALINGLPWESASDGQKMLASVAVKMAEHKRQGVKLSTIFLPRAALLDAEARSKIIELADREGFQIMFEITTDSHQLEVEIMEKKND